MKKIGNIYKENNLYFHTCWDIYSVILKKVKFSKNEKILDAGCGSGMLGRHIRKARLFGVDLSKLAIKKLDKSLYEKAVVAPLEKIPFSDKYFDSSISIQVIQFPEYPERVFEELIRVTKNRIIITSANFNWFRLKSIIYPPYRKRYLELISKERRISSEVFEEWAKKYNLKLRIFYLSNRYNWFRNLFGNLFASEVVGVFYLK